MDVSPRFGLWRRLVALWRAAGISVLTIVTAVSLLLARAILRPWPTLRRRCRVWHFSHWSRAVVAMLGGRTVWTGRVPAAPFFLASNHLGYLDIIVLAQRLPAVFVSKAEVSSWPVVGWLTRLADTLYINRERRSDIPRANATILAALERGDSVALFPEGTSSASDFVLPIRPPLLAVAAHNDFPVHTAALEFRTLGGDPPASTAICYFGDMAFLPHLWRLLHLRGFTATVRLADQPQRARDRKALAQRVHDAIHALQLQNHPRNAAANAPGVSSSTSIHPMSNTALHTLCTDNIRCLERLRDVVLQLDDAHFASAATPCDRGIGPHVRHILDHYDALWEGLENGTINYDQRRRDRDTETRTAIALERIKATTDRLAALRETPLSVSLSVCMDCGSAASTRLTAPTSLERELQFLVSHTVHHDTLIGAAATALGITVAPDFGVAPSTLRHASGRG